MSVSNEQAVLNAEKEILNKKQSYIEVLEPIAIAAGQSNTELTLRELLQLQQLGTEYFNYAENFVGNSGLLGAHSNGIWVTGFAETCYSILKVFITHISFLRSYGNLFPAMAIEPSPHSYANMQRMVKEYLPMSDWKELERNYLDANLPVSGFTRVAAEDKIVIPGWQRITGIIISIIAVSSILLISLVIPNPTMWQQFVFRGVMSIGLAYLIPMVPGFVKMKIQIKGFGQYLSIWAGGALAIFVLLWLVNPPEVL